VQTQIFFRPLSQKQKVKAPTDSKEVKEVVLDQVHFISENQLGHKLFDFVSFR
jgi:hypothetical protein